ncbi:DNA-directed RNA polymerase III subunit RPC4 [Glycine soja]
MLGHGFEAYFRKKNSRFSELVVLVFVLLKCKAMDPDQGSSKARKLKFKPRNLKPVRTPKTEADDKQKEDSAVPRALSRRQENPTKREPKVETKCKFSLVFGSSVEVAFSLGSSSHSLRTYGISKSVDSGSPSKYFANEQIRSRHSSVATEDQNYACMIEVTDDDDTTDASARKIKREYKEPWDYENSYYPTTLPLRKPNSGDPEILDDNSAAELGLLKKSQQQRMLFFKFPTLPLVKQTNKGKEKIGKSTVSQEATKSKSALEELPRGYMGKMLVYKSGAIKLKLGETMFDVSPGSNSVSVQDIVAVNTAQKQCCNLGELRKRVVVVPDLDSIEL